MSRTSLAAIGDKAATTWKNLVLCVVIFTVTAFVATASFQTDVDGPSDAEEVVVMEKMRYVSRRPSHKCGKWLC